MDWASQLDFSGKERKYKLPSGLLSAVMRAESNGDPKAVSPKGARGLFQFMPETAQGYDINPDDPEQAAEAAARMYADLSKQHGGDLSKMLAGYNWGSGNMAKHGLDNMPAETRDYISKVQSFMPKQYADAGNVMTDAITFDDLPDATPAASALSFDDLPDAEPAGPPMPPERPSFLERQWQGLKVGGQGVGRGMADLLGMPVDLTTLAINTPVHAANMLFDTEIPTIKNPVGGSDNIADVFSNTAEMAGYEPVEYENLDTANKLAYNVNRFGTGALAGGAGLMKAAETPIEALPSMKDAFLEAYRQNPSRALAVDTAAGVGSGAGVTAAEQYFPDNPIATLFGALLGGTAGSTTGGLMVAGKEGAKNVARDMTEGFSIDKTLPRDPDSKMPVKRSVADDAARYMQEHADNPETAKATLKENVDFYRQNDLPMPGTGALSNDVGMIGVERAARTADPTPFLKRDRAVREAQGEKLRSVGPEVPEENLRDAQKFAATEADTRLAAGKGKLTELEQTDAKLLDTRRALTADAAGAKTPDAASMALDDTLAPVTKAETARKADLYRSVDPEGEVLLDNADLMKAVNNIEQTRPRGIPMEDVVPQRWLDTLKKDFGEEDAAPLTFKELNDLRPKLAEMEKSARADNPLFADSLKNLRGYIGDVTENLAKQGNAAGQRAAAANTNFKERFAPAFRDKAVGEKYQRDVTKGLQNPSETGKRFLSSPERAQALKKIVSLAENPKEGLSRARDYMVSEMGRPGFFRSDGTFNLNALRAFRRNNDGVLKEIGMDADMDQLIKAAVNGEEMSNQLALKIKAAKGDLKSTEDEINKGVLRVLIDNEPENAAAKILSDSDPEKRMAETVALLGKNEDAKKAFQRSVADYLESKFTGTRTEQTATEDYAVLQSKVEAFMKKPGVEKALVKLYEDTPDAMTSLRVAQRIGRDIAKINIQATAGSPTAELGSRRDAFMKPLEGVLKAKFGALRGGSYMRTLRIARETIPGLDNDAAIQRLVIRAQLEPELALHLYGRDVEKMPARLWTKKLNRLLGYAAASREESDEDITVQPKEKGKPLKITIRPPKQ